MTTAPAPRTQAQRRASTQAKVLDATVEALVEMGYAGASTPAIQARRGQPGSAVPVLAHQGRPARRRGPPPARAGQQRLRGRLRRTFEPEVDPVRYGLTKNIDTYNPLRVATHELVALARDVLSASSWRDRAGYVFRGPGWSPEAV